MLTPESPSLPHTKGGAAPQRPPGPRAPDLPSTPLFRPSLGHVTYCPVLLEVFLSPPFHGPEGPCRCQHFSRAVRAITGAGFASAVLLFLAAEPVWAAATIPQVIDNLRNWIVGLLAGMATLFLTVGGLRYLMAGGDPGEVESAKRALKAAAIGYALAVLAPVLVSVLRSIVGAP